MNILINGKKADITLENEKTVGEILAGLEAWLGDSGHRLSGLVIDGETVDAQGMEHSFNLGLETIKKIDITTNSLGELVSLALINTIEDLAAFGKSDFESKRRFAEYWAGTPEARLLAEEIPEARELMLKTITGEGLSPEGLSALLEERLRELEDPGAELERSGPVVEETARRLEDLPLDIQTGKDSRAVETVRLFSGVAEKLFRIFNILKTGGGKVEDMSIEGAPAPAFIAGFSTTLRELLEAYEQKDAVLVGDLAEYELAPRLRSLYAAMKTPAALPA